MVGPMNNKLKKSKEERPERRAFFRQLFSSVGGGLLTGGLLSGVLRSGKRASNRQRPVSINVNPLAVPRKKEGSKSNV
jgi:hypothetical protein